MAWVRLAVWTLVGLVIYLLYGVQHSVLNAPPANSPGGVGRSGDVLLDVEMVVMSPSEGVLDPDACSGSEHDD